jgi:hypothetical protein
MSSTTVTSIQLCLPDLKSIREQVICIEERLNAQLEHRTMYDRRNEKLELATQIYVPGISETTLKIHLSDALDELDATQDCLAEIAIEKQRIEFKNQELHTQLVSTTGVRSILERLAEEKEAIIFEREAERDALQALISRLTSENEILRSQQDIDRSEMEDLRETVSALRNTQIVAREEQIEKDTLKAQLDALQSELDSVKADQEETINRKVAEQQSEIETAMRLTLDNMIAQNDQLEHLHQHAILDCHRKDATIAGLKKELNDIKIELETLVKEVEVQEVEIESHLTDIDEKTTTFMKLESELKESKLSTKEVNHTNSDDDQCIQVNKNTPTTTTTATTATYLPSMTGSRLSRWRIPGFGRKTHPLGIDDITKKMVLNVGKSTTDKLQSCNDKEITDSSSSYKKRRICISVAGGGTAHYSGPLNDDGNPEGTGTIRYESGETYVGQVKTTIDSGMTLKDGKGCLYYGPFCTQYVRGYFRADRLISSSGTTLSDSDVVHDHALESDDDYQDKQTASCHVEQS